jgi:hypothetical protein
MDVFRLMASLDDTHEKEMHTFYRMHLPRVYNYVHVDTLDLLKVPFHEEPWQDTGDDKGQQYVYIVKTSLDSPDYRYVLYLKDIKSMQYNNNKIYEMFTYSDLCWTRNKVPGYFQFLQSEIITVLIEKLH